MNDLTLAQAKRISSRLLLLSALVFGLFLVAPSYSTSANEIRMGDRVQTSMLKVARKVVIEQLIRALVAAAIEAIKESIKRRNASDPVSAEFCVRLKQHLEGKSAEHTPSKEEERLIETCLRELGGS